MGRKDVKISTKKIISEVKKEVINHNLDQISVEALLVGMLSADENIVQKTLANMGVDVNKLHDIIYEAAFNSNLTPKIVTVKSPVYSKDLKDVFRQVDHECENLGSIEIDSVHILLAILHIKPKVNKILSHFKIFYENFRQSFLSLSGSEELPPKSEKPVTPQDKTAPKSKTPALDNFSRNLTEAARMGTLDPVIGRDDEIKRMSQILARRKKQNPVILGDAGSGKSSLVEGLAIRINQGRVPRILANKKIYSLDVASIVAGTKYRGQFEERMKAIMDELTNNRDIIVFIDELHMLVGAGNANGSMDASNILKPSLANGEIQMIGATTFNEYRESIEKDSALTRRFQTIHLKEPSVEETITILKQIKHSYEKHHKVTYTDEALEECVKLAERYISDRFFPDKAIDILDEAGAATNIIQEKPDNIKLIEDERLEIIRTKEDVVKKRLYEEAAELKVKETEINKRLQAALMDWGKKLDSKKSVVGVEEICEVISISTGIPISKISAQENKKLLSMADTLKNKIIGQDEAIDVTVQGIKRARLGIKPKHKPLVYMYLGPSGCGKSELAKKLAEQLFGDSDALVRFDMSEYMEKHSISRLIGAAPGYVGYGEGGQLTEKIRRRPYSVILFDEIEKAHPETYNLFLQLFDDGRLTDGMGRKVDFKNTIIIMTSNIGVRELSESGQSLGFRTASVENNEVDRKKDIIKKALKKKFAPEFLNRVDEVVVFNSLSEDNIKEIIKLEITSLEDRLSDLGYKLKLDKASIDFLLKEGYDEAYGVRPLSRVIQNHVGNLIADESLSGSIKEGETVKISFNKTDNSLFVKK